MQNRQADEIEERIQRLHEAGNFSEAASVGIKAYGPGLFSFLVATTRNITEAEDVFSQASEDIWRGIKNFSWRSSFHTWAYALARNARIRYLSKQQKKDPFHDANLAQVYRIAEKIRTDTKPYLKTEVKNEFANLRNQLSLEEQELLILKIDRGMSWKAVARTMSESPVLQDEELPRAAALYRKRFERVKARLKSLAEEAGLLTVCNET